MGEWGSFEVVWGGGGKMGRLVRGTEMRWVGDKRVV